MNNTNHHYQYYDHNINNTNIRFKLHYFSENINWQLCSVNIYLEAIVLFLMKPYMLVNHYMKKLVISQK